MVLLVGKASVDVALMGRLSISCPIAVCGSIAATEVIGVPDVGNVSVLISVVILLPTLSFFRLIFSIVLDGCA